MMAKEGFNSQNANETLNLINHIIFVTILHKFLKNLSSFGSQTTVASPRASSHVA